MLEAIEVQESAGIEAVTDGEYRRTGWIALTPDRGRPALHPAGERLRVLERGLRLARPLEDGRRRPRRHVGLPPEEPFVTRRLEVERDIVGDEYSFLKANAHARAEVYDPGAELAPDLLAPRYSSDAYPTSDDFIQDVARLTREHVVDRLVELGCDYIQIDAPNYAQWHIDPGEPRGVRGARPRHGARARARTPSSTAWSSRASTGVTRAMHMCRGNAPGGMWAASGGYEAISKEVFPRLENVDRLLLEYDSDRAGTFAPLADVLPHHRWCSGL